MGLIKKGSFIDKGILVVKEQLHTYEPDTREEVIAEEGEAIPEVEVPEMNDIAPQIEAPAETVQIPEMPLEERQAAADDIVRKAMEEAESIKEQARESGIEEAKRFAEENASDKVKEALATVNQAVIERKKIIKDSEAEILRLSLRVAEQIIRSEVSLHRDVCMNIVSDAINRVSDREQVIIRVNREDLENIKKYKDRISSIVDGIKSLSIIEDAAVEAGGCVIETNLGYVDARISTKIAAIEDAFKKAAATGGTHK
jgi:flagellar assembly protein FliH